MVQYWKSVGLSKKAPGLFLPIADETIKLTLPGGGGGCSKGPPTDIRLSLARPSASATMFRRSPTQRKQRLHNSLVRRVEAGLLFCAPKRVSFRVAKGSVSDVA